jgi:diacylglycerol diphosphate phosphatase/phosphatidate phosphatase
MFTPEVCTNPDKGALRTAMTGFPSGHSATAFAGFTFLFLWMNAKLKVWANYQPSLYWLALLLCPILGAILIAGSLTIDMAHHWYDIVGGAVLGFALAVMVYRVLYAAVWDWRYNHVPLRRDREYDYTFRSDGAYVMPHPDMWTHRDIFVRKLNWMTKSDWERMRPERREELGKAMRASRVNGHKGPDPATLRDEQVEEAGVSYPQLAPSEPLEGNAVVGARQHKPPTAGDEMV